MFDVLVGINLLREGLDLPEVSLVAILDADKEGFLRSERSLIQTFGRAARNVNGRVIIYADHMTDPCAPPSTRPTAGAPSSSATTRSTASRRRPFSKAISAVAGRGRRGGLRRRAAVVAEAGQEYVPLAEIPGRIAALRKEMREAAADLEFERAADLRDEIQRLQHQELALRDAP